MVCGCHWSMGSGGGGVAVSTIHSTMIKVPVASHRMTLHLVWEQLINGFADQHRFRCGVYVFWVYVYVEQREDAHHYVHDDQPACHTTHDDVHMITPIAVADEGSI